MSPHPHKLAPTLAAPAGRTQPAGLKQAGPAPQGRFLFTQLAASSTGSATHLSRLKTNPPTVGSRWLSLFSTWRGLNTNGPERFTNGPKGFADGPAGFANGAEGFADGREHFANGPEGFSDGLVGCTDGSEQYAA